MAEDLPFKLGEEGAGLETELVAQDLPSAPIHLERVCVAAGAIERDHELAAELFAQGVFGDAFLQLGHELGMVTELELRLDPLFSRGEAELLQASDLELGPFLVLELLKRPSAPQCKRTSRVRVASSASCSAASLVSRSNSLASVSVATSR